MVGAVNAVPGIRDVFSGLNLSGSLSNRLKAREGCATLSRLNMSEF